MLVADKSYLLSASFHFLDFSLHSLLSYNECFFRLLYLKKSYQGIAHSIVVSLGAIDIAFKRMRKNSP